MADMRKSGIVAAALAWLAMPAAAARSPSTLIDHVLVIDGTGSPAKIGAVRISGDRIVSVGALKRKPGEPVIDGLGQVLAPGFIDTHSHHDIGIFDMRAATPVVSGGVTTIVVGQDGFSEPPVSKFFARLRRTPVAINIASYAGHGAIRGVVMGDDYKRKATPVELRRMEALLRREMMGGALGLSSGLEYDPGIYSSKAEVLALARTSARSGGRYISHMRSEDKRLWEALDELITIGRETRAPVQVSHAKIALVDAWGQAPRFIAKMDAARAAGVDVTADVYPYPFWQSTLTVLFPERNFRDRAAAEFALRSLAPAAGLRLSRFKPDPGLVGKTVAEIAGQRGTDEAQTLMDLIAESGSGSDDDAEMVIATSMRQDDIDALIRWPHSNICSDGMLKDRHPRGTGSFTRILSDYVRDRHVLTLEEAVHKMTQLAAVHMGIRDRGVVKPGAYADLVLFDPATVDDRATIDDPSAQSVGIAQVWVNGRTVFRDGKSTAAYPGRPLPRHP